LATSSFGQTPMPNYIGTGPLRGGWSRARSMAKAAIR
jgi:hypothetical protein